MSSSFAMVELIATRSIAQARPSDALSLEGVRLIELSLSASDAAVHDGIEIRALRGQLELSMRALGVSIRSVDFETTPSASPSPSPQSASVSVRVEGMAISSPAALVGLQLAADRLKSMRSVRPLRQMEEHEAVIAWQGLELGAEKGGSFASGASSALALLLDDFATDFRRANPRDS